MKPYMASGDCPEEGACLVFASSVKEAKKLAYPVVSGWGMIDQYIDLRVTLLKHHDYLLEQANKELLSKNVAHVIESPTTCHRCELWGTGQLDGRGICPDCVELEELEQGEQPESHWLGEGKTT